MEHRQAHREPTDILVLVSTPDGVTRKGYIKDISMLGAGVVMNSGEFTRGSVVDLWLSATDNKQYSHKSRLRGFVVRAQDGRIGLLWMTENAISHILTEIERHDFTPGDMLRIA